MKKTIFLTSAIAVLTLTSCKKENADATKEGAKTEATSEAAPAPANANIPDFDDPKLDEYVKNYEELMTLYNEAITNKDMSKMQELQTKASEMATQGQAFTSVSADDTKKLQDYMTKKSQELQAMMSKMLGK